MKRTRQCYSMFEPEIYKILQETEPNISLYIHDLVCADLISHGKLETKRLIELRLDLDEEDTSDIVNTSP